MTVASDSEDVEVTGVAQKRAWANDVLPPVEEVRPGLWSIPVPIPDSPLRYVLVYAFETAGGLVMVDAGWDSEQSWDELVSGLACIGAQPSDVRGVLITHMHADHFGLAPRLRHASGAWLAMHEADAALVQAPPDDREIRAGVNQMAELGAPPDLHQGVGRFPGPLLTPDEAPELLLADGDIVPAPGWELSAVWTPGHTPGHLCFAEGRHRLLLTGDHVLPRISPMVNVLPGQLSDPLGDYLDSLHKLRGHDPTEVLPAHEYRFTGLDTRLDQLIAHHDERLEAITDVVGRSPGSSAYEVAAGLPWSREFRGMSSLHRRMATRETLAHLVLLESRGRVRGDVRGRATGWQPHTEIVGEVRW